MDYGRYLHWHQHPNTDILQLFTHIFLQIAFSTECRRQIVAVNHPGRPMGGCRKSVAVSQCGEGELFKIRVPPDTNQQFFFSVSKVCLDPSGPYVLNYLPLAHVWRSGISFILLSIILITPFFLCLSVNASFYSAPTDISVFPFFPYL